ncbi:oligosaccharide flippase family protein [Paenisporosarcina macmurdoensis]|uniref:Oligosaccharide flippase family protein n=1 Tax=Paenisporosarcina macmurdoensis TaxID=212659 RepID=A0ABW1L8D7_9BACL
MNNLMKNFSAFSYGTILSLLIAFLAIPILTRILSPEEYGKITLFVTLSGIFSTIISFGTDQAFVRFFYEEHEDNRGKLLRKTLIIPSALTIIFIVIMLFFGSKITLYYFDDNSLSIILSLIAFVTFSLIYNFGLLVVRMQQKGNTYSLLLIFNKIIYLLLIISLIYLIPHTYMIGIGSLLISLMLSVIVIIFIERIFWFKKIKKDTEKLINNIKTISLFSFPFFVTLLINLIFKSADKFALEGWGSYEDLGIYSSGVVLVGMLGVLQASFTIFWTPVAYKKYELEPENKQFFKIISQIVSFIMIAIALIVVMIRDYIILFLGEDYREAIFILPMLLFIPIATTISETTQIGINFKKKPRYHIITAIIASLVNLIFLFILVPTYGAKGAAISTALGYLSYLLFRTVFSQMLFKIEYGLKNLSLIVCLLFCYMLHLTFYDTSIFSLTTGICLFLLNIYLYKDIFKIFVDYHNKSSDN